jgi:glycosyltransferase involved in cell wall biosynthesis
VVPNHTSTKEIFEGHGELIRCDHIDVDPNYGRNMPCPSVEHLAEILANLYEDREHLDHVAQSCYERVTEAQFDWANIADQFDGVFQEVLQAEQLESAESVSCKKKGISKKKRKKMFLGD